MYEAAADVIKNADLAYINQETMTNDDLDYSGYPAFNSPEALLDDLKAVGFDIVGIANNHTLDNGRKSVETTMDS